MDEREANDSSDVIFVVFQMDKVLMDGFCMWGSSHYLQDNYTTCHLIKSSKVSKRKRLIAIIIILINIAKPYIWAWFKATTRYNKTNINVTQIHYTN